ncbi:hypothetical protein JQM66_07855 [Oscillibacter valericigenes]|uniref:hypothetical protein n=1 Tax=Oscillibacter valericigenes TaxID=351091 RepID=UPI001F47146D|nr:hypothetical protein [Oscillibacter valericigenes]MCF2664476.1 hypothetical protein [Oscillibacter valericigenes]
MTLLEMSAYYADSAALIRTRIAELRAAERAETDPDAARRLRLRIETLRPLLRETRELAVLTARYYDRSYHKHEKYTL